MARMYPEKPRLFDQNSHEGEMFEALCKLPDSYLVIHSWKQTTTRNGILEERQGDFLIYHKEKGILCIEAKSSGKYENGIWKYASGKEMEYNGPYNQAANEKYSLKQYFEDLGYKNLIKKCKFLHAVWFYYVNRAYIESLSLPPEANENITLTLDSFENIESEIERVFSNKIIIKGPNAFEVVTSLTDKEDDLIVNKILAPRFNLCSYKEIINGAEKISFLRLENEQKAVLNYIEEEHSAIIQGLGGTGKTILAEEYAKRKNDLGESVLFLCYNKKLYKKIKDIDLIDYPFIHVYNIDTLVIDYGFSFQDYKGFNEKLYEMYINGSFPYKHVIVDEGQDFGTFDSDTSLAIEEEKEKAKDRVEIIKTLKEIVTSDDRVHQKGTFYLFYDKNQMVQSDILPNYIFDADCKLSLYKNCRNTSYIAETSTRFLNDNVKMKLRDSTINGKPVELYFEHNREDVIFKLNELIEFISLNICELTQIQILTCNSEENSIITSETIKDSSGDYYYRTRKGEIVPFTSCSKFKGLEAEAVVMVDIDEHALCNKKQKLYVGASRAKRRLFLITCINEESCRNVLKNYGKKPRGNLQQQIKSLFNCKLG